MEKGAGDKERCASPYEAPELISYNTSEITLGAVRRVSDFIGGNGTTYKS